MSGKRGHGEGTIYRDPTGRWHGQISLPNGKRKNVYGKTRREVQESIAQVRREVDAGMHGTKDGEQPLRTFAKDWLDHHRHRLRSHTFSNYESIWRVHLDRIGDIQLVKLKPMDIQQHYTRKLQSLSATSVHHIHAFLHVVLDSAVRLGIIPRNYADYVDAPGLRTAEMVPLNESDARKLMASVQGHRHEAIIIMALATGMREGELLGLRWEAIDWERGVVHVETTLHMVKGTFVLEPPKSRTSRRALPLLTYVREVLLRHQQHQHEERALMGAAWGNAWNLVFTTEAGLPLRYDQFVRQFHALMAMCALPTTTRFHDLRHTFATLLIERGVSVKVVSELLGHSSIAITLAVYAHVTQRMRDNAIQELNDLIAPTQGLLPAEQNT